MDVVSRGVTKESDAGSSMVTLLRARQNPAVPYHRVATVDEESAISWPQGEAFGNRLLCLGTLLVTVCIGNGTTKENLM